MNLNHPATVTLAGLTEADFDDALTHHYGPSRHRAVQATVAECSGVKRPYIPLGCAQQGRVEDGARAPMAAEASNELCLEDDGEPWQPAPPELTRALFGWVALAIVALAIAIAA